jgi:anti-anti-sigma factor
MTPGGVTIIERGNVVIAGLTGDIDMMNIGDLYTAVTGGMTNAAAGLIVDLSDVTYLDSAGVRFLFDLGKRLRRHRQELRIVAPDHTAVRRVLEIVNMDAHVPMYATLGEAHTWIDEMGTTMRWLGTKEGNGES